MLTPHMAHVHRHREQQVYVCDSVCVCVTSRLCPPPAMQSFGKVPEYLTHRKEEMRAAQEAYDRYVAESFQQGSMHQLGEEERETILEGLKRNWEELHHRYQGLSVVTDTAPKKARKERMEAEMKQLERDIELIEKHSIVYVAQ